MDRDPRVAARATRLDAGDRHGRRFAAVLRYASDSELRAIARMLYVAGDGRAVVQEFDIHTAQRRGVVNPNGRPEAPAGVLGERDMCPRLVPLSGKPRDDQIASSRGQCGTIHRTRLYAPVVVVDRGWLRP